MLEENVDTVHAVGDADENTVHALEDAVKPDASGNGPTEEPAPPKSDTEKKND